MTCTFLRTAFLMQNLSTVHAADAREFDEIVVPASLGLSAFVDARDMAAAAAKGNLRCPGSRRYAGV